MAGLGTLEEVSRRWSIDRLMDAHELLDLREAQEARAMAGVKTSR